MEIKKKGRFGGLFLNTIFTKKMNKKNNEQDTRKGNQNKEKKKEIDQKYCFRLHKVDVESCERLKIKKWL